MRSPTAEFVDAVMSIAKAPLPDDVRTVAACCILDWLGVTIAGAREPAAELLVPDVLASSDGPCTLVGRTERVGPLDAALINGVAGDALDYSDCIRAMNGHATATVLPAVLAHAEATGASGADVLRAFVVGVEAACRVGRVVGEGVLETAFHPTAIAGPFGAAAGVAVLLRLEAPHWMTAFGIAATQAAGLADAMGTMCKPLHAGMAAANGLRAARLAGRGFTGSEQTFDPAGGFLRTATVAVDRAALTAARERYFIRETLLKEHAACQLTHGGIENVLRFGREHRFVPEDIAAIQHYIAASSAAICDIVEPRSGLEAKFSIRTVTAMALLGYDTGNLASYRDDVVGAPAIAALRQRIGVQAERDRSIAVTRSRIEFRDGRVFEAEHDERQFDPDPAHRATRTRHKFAAVTAGRVGSDVAQEIERVAFDLERIERIDELFAKLPR